MQDLLVIGIGLWLALSAIVAVAANSRGRNPFGWLAIALFAAPVAGFLYPLVWVFGGFSIGLTTEQIYRELLWFTGWLAMCAIASPVLGGLLLYAMPPLAAAGSATSAAAGPGSTAAVIHSRPSPPPGAALGEAEPFEPEAIMAGIPYRMNADGSVEAVMQGARVRFSTLKHLADAAGRASG